MEHLTIANFKFGLDTRRSELTSQPGTLVNAVDCHINQGGQLEKRKAFVKLGQLPASCFGLQETSVGLTTFGSTDSGSVVIPAALSAAPANLTYQRLQHIFETTSWPALDTSAVVENVSQRARLSGTATLTIGSNTFVIGDTVTVAGVGGTGYNAVGVVLTGKTNTTISYANAGSDESITASGGGTATMVSLLDYPPPAHTAPAMTGVVTSCAFGGKTFVVASFGAGGLGLDASKQCFYDGNVVIPNVLGLLYTSQIDNWVYAAAMAYDYIGQYFTGVTGSGFALSTSGTTAIAGFTFTLASITGVATITTTSALASLVIGPGSPNTMQFKTQKSPRLAWDEGSTWNEVIVQTGIAYTFGAGNIINVSPTALCALGTKLYLVFSNQFSFSKINDATKWEQQDTGAGFVMISDIYNSPTDAVAAAPYQGKLALFSRYNTQIWNVASSPANYSQSQSLQNIGTFASLSVQSVGDLDVLFLSDTGVRSLRVRDSSNNAYVADLGSPIDQIIQQSLIANADADNAKACAIVEPSSGRYWLYLNGTIYVLSYYPNTKIIGWTTYTPVAHFGWFIDINSGNTGEVTVKFRSSTGVHTVTVPWHTDITTTAADLVTAINGNFGSLVASSLVGHVQVTPPAGYVTVLFSVSPTGTLNVSGGNAFLGTFQPVKFCVYNGRVYALDRSNNVYIYGGIDGNTYDATVATVETSWLDLKKPFALKTSDKINVAKMGNWLVQAGMDPRGSNLINVVPLQTPEPTAADEAINSTFDEGSFSWSAIGTHFKLKATTSSMSDLPAVFSALTLQYNTNEES